MKPVFGEAGDVDSWMWLVRAVTWNFPGLETEERLREHEATVLRFMQKRQALCVPARSGGLLGRHGCGEPHAGANCGAI